MIFPKDREQPISLTDANGHHWVDNGDGTVTWMNDPDGESDIPWDSLDSTHTDVSTLHTQDCRRSALSLRALVCSGGWVCADIERTVYDSSQARSTFAKQNWGVIL